MLNGQGPPNYVSSSGQIFFPGNYKQQHHTAMQTHVKDNKQVVY